MLKRVKRMVLNCYCKERCASSIYWKRASLGDFGTLIVRNQLTLQQAPVFFGLKIHAPGVPWWLSGKESTGQCGKHRLAPRSGKIPHTAENLGPCTTTIEPGSRTRKLQLLKPMYPRDGALQQDKPLRPEQPVHNS